MTPIDLLLSLYCLGGNLKSFGGTLFLIRKCFVFFTNILALCRFLILL